MNKLEDILGLFQRNIERKYGGRTAGNTLTGEEAVQRIKDLMHTIYDEDYYTFKKNLEEL